MTRGASELMDEKFIHNLVVSSERMDGWCEEKKGEMTKKRWCLESNVLVSCFFLTFCLLIFLNDAAFKKPRQHPPS